MALQAKLITQILNASMTVFAMRDNVCVPARGMQCTLESFQMGVDPGATIWGTDVYVHQAQQSVFRKARCVAVKCS